METDAEIIALVLNGKTQAFERIVERYKHRCVRYAFRFLGDMDEAEDVTQETFVRAYKSLDKLVSHDRFGAWLFQILINRCRSSFDQKARQERWLQPMENIEEIVDPLTEAPAAFRQSDNLEDLLQKLGSVYREALILKYIDDMTYDEMSEVTGVGVSALKMRVKRGMNMLRDRLAMGLCI